jgi:hypothetical protein
MEGLYYPLGGAQGPWGKSRCSMSPWESCDSEGGARSLPCASQRDPSRSARRAAGRSLARAARSRAPRDGWRQRHGTRPVRCRLRRNCAAHKACTRITRPISLGRAGAVAARASASSGAPSRRVAAGGRRSGPAVDPVVHCRSQINTPTLTDRRQPGDGWLTPGGRLCGGRRPRASPPCRTATASSSDTAPAALAAPASPRVALAAPTCHSRRSVSRTIVPGGPLNAASTAATLPAPCRRRRRRHRRCRRR